MNLTGCFEHSWYLSIFFQYQGGHGFYDSKIKLEVWLQSASVAYVSSSRVSLENIQWLSPLFKILYTLLSYSHFLLRMLLQLLCDLLTCLHKGRTLWVCSHWITLHYFGLLLCLRKIPWSKKKGIFVPLYVKIWGSTKQKTWITPGIKEPRLSDTLHLFKLFTLWHGDTYGHTVHVGIITVK